MTAKICFGRMVCWLLACLAFLQPAWTAAASLEDLWNNPPTESRLRAYWWWLNGNVTKESITRDLEQMKAKGIDPHQAKPNDSPGVGAWRERMGTDEAKTIYKRRAQTSEWANARVRNCGLRQFLVRGLEKVRAATLLYALAHNLMQTVLLKARLAAG